MERKQTYFGWFVLVLGLIFSYPVLKSGAVNLFKQDTGLSVEEFLNRVNNKNKPVLVYFNADWCAACIKSKQMIEEIRTEERQNCEVIKLDVDANPKVAAYLEINTLPVFMIYKNGKQTMKYDGVLSKKDLIGKIASNR